MQRRVALLIKSCDIYQKNKSLNYAASGKTTAHQPTRKLEKVSIDLMGPLPTGQGGIHCIRAIFHIFTKYIRLYVLKCATTKAILNRIVKDYILSTGKPEAILSDNSTQLTSKIWASILEKIGIKKNFTTKYSSHCGYNQCPKTRRKTK